MLTADSIARPVVTVLSFWKMFSFWWSPQFKKPHFIAVHAGDVIAPAHRPDRRALWRELRAMSAAAHCGGMYHSHIADQLASADPFCM